MNFWNFQFVVLVNYIENSSIRHVYIENIQIQIGILKFGGFEPFYIICSEEKKYDICVIYIQTKKKTI